MLAGIPCPSQGCHKLSLWHSWQAIHCNSGEVSRQRAWFSLYYNNVITHKKLGRRVKIAVKICQLWLKAILRWLRITVWSTLIHGKILYNRNNPLNSILTLKKRGAFLIVRAEYLRVSNTVLNWNFYSRVQLMKIFNSLESKKLDFKNFHSFM